MKKENIISFGILGIFVLWLVLTFPNFYPIQEITVYLIVALGKVLSISAVPYKEYIVVNFGDINRIFQLSVECSGIVLYMVFLAGTFLIPSFRLRDRLVGLAFIPILLLGNVMRILISIYLAKDYSIDLSLFFHNTIGQVFIFAVGIFSYLGWLKLTGNFKKDKPVISN